MKVNVDEAHEISQHVGISCMPTFKFYKNGQLAETLEGASEAKLRENLEKLLKWTE